MFEVDEDKAAIHTLFALVFLVRYVVDWDVPIFVIDGDFLLEFNTCIPARQVLHAKVRTKILRSLYPLNVNRVLILRANTCSASTCIWLHFFNTVEGRSLEFVFQDLWVRLAILRLHIVMIGKTLHIRRLWGCWNLTRLVESIDIIDLHVVCRVTRWTTSTLCELIWLWSLRMNLIRVGAEWAHSLFKLTWMPQLVNLVSWDCMMHLAGNTVSVVLVRATIAITLGHHLEIVEVVSADTVCL